MLLSSELEFIMEAHSGISACIAEEAGMKWDLCWVSQMKCQDFDIKLIIQGNILLHSWMREGNTVLHRWRREGNMSLHIWVKVHNERENPERGNK